MLQRVVAVLLGVGSILTALPARAADYGTGELPTFERPSERLRRVTLTFNPLPVLVGRYGANVEVVPFAHHAIVASAFVQTYPRALARTLLPDYELDPPETRWGGELGYRLYSGRDGASGLFVGPSFVAMPMVVPRVTEDLRPEVLSLMSYGAALDVGAQLVTGTGFTIGAGVGVMALAYSPPPSVQIPTNLPITLPKIPEIPEPHVLPRVLLTAGWSF